MPKVKLHGTRFDAIDVQFRSIRDAIYRVPEVESAYISVERGCLDVWVIVPERNTRVLGQLADTQWKLYEGLGPAGQMPFSLELHVIYRSGRPEKDLAPLGAVPLPRQAL